MLGTGIPLTSSQDKLETILETNNKTASLGLIKYTVHKLWLWKAHWWEVSFFLFYFFFLWGLLKSLHYPLNNDNVLQPRAVTKDLVIDAKM